MILNFFFAQIGGFIWTTVMWCFGKNIFYFLVFFVKNAKNNVFEDKWFLSKMFSQIKCRRLQTGLATLKNIKHLIFFQTTDFLYNFQKSHFSEIFENHQ